MRVSKTMAWLVAVYLGVSCSVFAQDKARFPERLAPPVALPPKVDSAPVTSFKSDEWYIIDTETPGVLLASPEGFVRITYESNADSCKIRYRGKFAGGSGLDEERTFTGKQLIHVEPIANGKCELIFIPFGFKDQKEIIRKTVEVVVQGPRPPPTDPPTDTVPSSSLYFLIVRANTPATPEFADLMANEAWSQLRKQGHSVKDFTLSESAKFYNPPSGTNLPYVVTLQKVGNNMKVVAPPKDVPTKTEDILNLPKGVK